MCVCRSERRFALKFPVVNIWLVYSQWTGYVQNMAKISRFGQPMSHHRMDHGRPTPATPGVEESLIAATRQRQTSPMRWCWMVSALRSWAAGSTGLKEKTWNEHDVLKKLPGCIGRGSIFSDNPGVLKLIVRKKGIMLGIMDGDYCLVESPT